MGWHEVEQAFNQAVEHRVFPGATVVVRKGGDIVFDGAFGYRTLLPEPSRMNIETIFDLSSLTKVLATSIAVMMLTRDAKLRLNDRVTRVFPNFGVHGKGGVIFRNLLAHCSGLAAWRPFYKRIAEIERAGRVNFMSSSGAKAWTYEEIHREKPEVVPGTKAIYSDLNFILLGEAIEQAAGAPLNRFCRDQIYRPLGLTATGFVDIALARTTRMEPVPEMFAATENCPSRKRLLIGEVDDENAFAMGGVSGHAGLFAPVRDVDKIAAELIACYKNRSTLVPRHTIQEFWTRDPTVPGSTWALGWDTPSLKNSSSGHHFPPAAVGHLGFTGTSIWIDPEREISISLMTNRVHPSRDRQTIREFRPKIHDLIMETIEGG